MTGIEFEIAPGANNPQVDHAVRLARELAEAAAPTLPALRVTLFPDPSIGPDGAFALAREGDAVTIKGDAEGLRCGLYTLLNALGFHWHNPTEAIIVPRAPPELDWDRLAGVHRPDFAWRGLHICAGRHHYDEAVARWMSFNRMNRKLTHLYSMDVVGDDLARLGIRPDTTVHAYSHLIPDDTHFAEHPEWFARIAGKRVRQKDGGQLCLANPEMRAAFARKALEHINARPDLGVFGICPNDGYGWCECDGCRALDTPADREAGTMNRRVADFVDDICRRVAEARPQARLGHYSYSNFADFLGHMPAGVPPNLQISFTQSHCYRHTLNDRACPVNSPIGTRLEKIIGLGARVYLYDYYTYRWGSLPAPFWRTQNADFAAWKQMGVDGFLTEVPGADDAAWRSFWPAIYLASRLLWNADLEADGLIREFCRIRYGAAASGMEGYFQALMGGFDAAEGCFDKNPAAFGGFFTPETRERAARFLSDAAKLAPENALVAGEIELFNGWRDNQSERGRYTSDMTVVPHPLAADAGAAAPQRIFLVDRETQLPNRENDTRVRVFADEEWIRFHVSLMESRMGSLKAAEGIYGGDSVEVFVSDGDDPQRCYQFLVAPDGRIRANAAKGAQWNWAWVHGATVQARQGDEGWEIDLAIPKRSVNAGDEFGFSIIRNRHAGGRWEVLGAPSGGAFFRPFGYIRAIGDRPPGFPQNTFVDAK